MSQAISTMLAQYGQQPSAYGLGNSAGLNFGGGGSGDSMRAASLGSAYGSSDISQGFPQVCMPLLHRAVEILFRHCIPSHPL